MSAAADPVRAVSLAGKVALVTGAGGGIGSAVARWLAAAGARALACALPGPDGPPGPETRPCAVGD